MPSIRLSTGLVHYIDEGDGPPVVLLHANPGDSLDFEAIIPALSSHYRVIAVDWPGYGSSEVPAKTGAVDVLYFYRALREIVDALALPPALFIGNSLGGNAAARLASRRPESVRGLVLVSPGGFTSPNAVTRAFSSLQASAFSLPPHWFAALYLKCNTPTVRAMLGRAKNEQSSPARISLSRALWRSFARHENDLRDEARSITVPTLLVFGERDPVISARRDGRNAAQAISGSRFVSLPCGHAPFAEVPDLFLSEISPFLSRCCNA